MITTGSVPKALRPSKPKKPRVKKPKTSVKVKKLKTAVPKETMLERLIKE